VPGRAELRRQRAAAQLLGERAARGPEEIVGHLLAVQAQDLRAARLALRARGSGFGASDVDAALADGRLVVSWLLRGTLHLVRAEDWPWLHALTADRPRATSARRLGQLGVAPPQAERAVEIIRAAVAGGPRTRAELADLVAAEGIPTEGQATPHLLLRAAMDGVIVMCGAQRFRSAPATAAGDRDTALGELARRYLRAHAPAGEADLAAWSGLPLRDVRRGLEGAGDVGAPDAPERIPARLLPAFDPYLLGWKDRSFAVPGDLAREVHPGGGMLRAVVTDDGLVTGTWSTADPPPGDEGDDVARFLGA
jgi:hypothetical protein